MASSSSKSASFQLWNHDVFLSFRGEDTRKTFVDHLYTSLVQHGIYTYKDDEALPRGESIGPALLKAILESRVAVIVFSENYANSSWCLEELAYIMKCMDERGQIVIPIFYHVDPSDVRKQKGKYGEAFIKHELENKNKVESWRKALVAAGSLSGWVPEDTANGHEAKFIKEIVDTISHRLYSLVSSENEHLIGMQALKFKLEIGSGGVLMIGIWGVGGGGKTTLASSVYDNVSGKFDDCCFLENIREKSSKYGLEKLQEKILSAVSIHKVKIGRVEEGRRMIKSRLCHRKVLIVLDDVNHIDHLEALAGSHDWFGEGSRIIITTRDENLLNAHKVNLIHHISLLNNAEAIELFSKHALGDYKPTEDYELLSKDVVSYANGLPLALKVLGSFLCDKDMNEWRSALARLKKLSHDDIMGTLKISYDGLRQVEKRLFLDIACFFRGEDKNLAMDIFDACGLHPVIGVKVLIQKALITISDARFHMHDLVQEMGHYIVRGEHPNNPENHSRVWEEKEVRNIWAMHATKELDKIEAIRVSSYMYRSLPHHNRHVITKMKKLQWIEWIEWKVHYASSLPTNFIWPEELCCLILRGVQHRQLWKGFKCLPNLRMIKLQFFDNLVVTPDFSGIPNLEKLMLSNCLYLEEIHPSIGCLEKLVYLSIESCYRYKMFPPMNVIKKLKTLIISDCKKLSTIGKKVSSFEEYCTNLCVTCFPCCHSNAYDDEVSEPFILHKGMNRMRLQLVSTGLRKLTLRQCHLEDEDIDPDAWDLPNLKELDLSINLISRLNFSILKVPRLKWLDVAQCTRLVELSGLPSSLAALRADWCDSLEVVGNISSKWLWNVSFFGRNSGLRALGGDMLLESILQGNAIEDHFISFTHSAGHHIPERFVDRSVRGKTFRLQLPDNWYNDYSGFLMFNSNNYYALYFTISIKQDLDNDSGSEVLQESDEAPESSFLSTYVGYVSFNSLIRHATRLNSAYNAISISIHTQYKTSYEGESRFAVELVPRKHSLQTKVARDCSEFDDEEREYGKTFTIQHHSESCIKILWRPCYWY